MPRSKITYLLLPLFFLLFGCMSSQRNDLGEKLRMVPIETIGFKIDGKRYIFESKVIKRTLTITQFDFRGDLKTDSNSSKENRLELRLRVRLDSSKMSVTLNNHQFDKKVFTSLSPPASKKRLRPPLRFYIKRFSENSALGNIECDVINFKVNLIEGQSAQHKTVSGTFEGIACDINGNEKHIIDGVIHKVKIKKSFW